MDSEFGDTLRALRNQAGMSLHALSQKIHWSKAAVGHAETGAGCPRRTWPRHSTANFLPTVS
ncbi:helix-turn-helix domain-containing protein [Krasilnikovia sp. MM14-A1259]|uniref:helix-turn-helix domain-containing protein n=1 Tax=Krasilnikovia sp. MM14-A1259 TaxID=3373539 RepID=UPI00381795CF